MNPNPPLKKKNEDYVRDIIETDDLLNTKRKEEREQWGPGVATVRLVVYSVIDSGG